MYLDYFRDSNESEKRRCLEVVYRLHGGHILGKDNNSPDTDKKGTQWKPEISQISQTPNAGKSSTATTAGVPYTA